MRAATKHDIAWMAGIAGTTAAFALLLVRPQIGRMHELRSTLQAEKTLISAGQDDQQELPRMQHEVDQLREQVERFEKQIPERDQLGAYLESLAGVAQEHRLRPEAIEPGTPTRSRDLQAVPIVLKVRGPFEDVYGMLKDVLALPRLTQVQRFDAKASPDRPGHVQAEMQLRVFYRAS